MSQSLYWRALFQVIFRDVTRAEYVNKALRKLGMEKQVSLLLVLLYEKRKSHALPSDASASRSASTNARKPKARMQLLYKYTAIYPFYS